MDFEELEEDEGEVTEVDIHGLEPPPIVDFEDETALSQGWYTMTIVNSWWKLCHLIFTNYYSERELEFQECEHEPTNCVSSDSEGKINTMFLVSAF